MSKIYKNFTRASQSITIQGIAIIAVTNERTRCVNTSVTTSTIVSITFIIIYALRDLQH